jgi:uncharacterized repeat protein (TIGR01451 family)
MKEEASMRPQQPRPRGSTPLGYLWVLAVVAAAALAFAGVGSAAPSGSADLRIVKSGSPDPVSLGSTLTYAIGVQNLGPDAATGVIVTDQLPQGVDFVAATPSSGQCTQRGRKVTCELGGIGAPGVDYSGPPTVTLSVIPRKAGTITNTAAVKGDQKDPVAANDKATATTTVVGPPVTCRGIPVTITGTAGNETIVGTGGRDVIAAFAGHDTVIALAGQDLICAGRGNDYVGAGSAADRVFGAAGKDRLLGRGGPDLLRGSDDDDVLKGNRGDDRLRGGSGFDRCRGGAGRDSIRGCER